MRSGLRLLRLFKKPFTRRQPHKKNPPKPSKNLTSLHNSLPTLTFYKRLSIQEGLYAYSEAIMANDEPILRTKALEFIIALQKIDRKFSKDSKKPEINFIKMAAEEQKSTETDLENISIEYSFDENDYPALHELHREVMKNFREFIQECRTFPFLTQDLEKIKVRLIEQIKNDTLIEHFIEENTFVTTDALKNLQVKMEERYNSLSEHRTKFNWVAAIAMLRKERNKALITHSLLELIKNIKEENRNAEKAFTELLSQITESTSKTLPTRLTKFESLRHIFPSREHLVEHPDYVAFKKILTESKSDFKSIKLRCKQVYKHYEKYGQNDYAAHAECLKRAITMIESYQAIGVTLRRNSSTFFNSHPSESENESSEAENNAGRTLSAPISSNRRN